METEDKNEKPVGEEILEVLTFLTLGIAIALFGPAIALDGPTYEYSVSADVVTSPDTQSVTDLSALSEEEQSILLNGLQSNAVTSDKNTVQSKDSIRLESDYPRLVRFDSTVYSINLSNDGKSFTSLFFEILVRTIGIGIAVTSIYGGAKNIAQR